MRLRPPLRNIPTSSISTTMSNDSSMQSNFIFRSFLGFSFFLLLLTIILYERLVELGDGGGLDRMEGLLPQNPLRRHNNKKRHHHRHHNEAFHSKNIYILDATQETNPTTKDKEEPHQKHHKHIQNHPKDNNNKKALTLREEFEQTNIVNHHSWHEIVHALRLPDLVQALRFPDFPVDPAAPYDVYNCPMDPPANYPFAWSLQSVLENWNPSDVSPPETAWPSFLYQSLCVMDWKQDEEKARTYIEANVPFVVQNFPDTLQAAARWTTPGYLERLLANNNNKKGEEASMEQQLQGVLRSIQNWIPESWSSFLHITNTDVETSSKYFQWLEQADEIEMGIKQVEDVQTPFFELRARPTHHDEEEDMMDEDDFAGLSHRHRQQQQQQHDPNNHAYLYDELPFLNPNHASAISPLDDKGIHCQFGVPGAIEDAHFEAHNSFVGLLGGQKR